MALRHVDSTSHYATADILAIGKWAEGEGATITSANPRREGTKSIVPGPSAPLTSVPISAPVSYAVLGFALRSSAKVFTAQFVSGSTVQLSLRWNGTTLSVSRGDLATLLATMDVSTLLFANNWYHFTFAAKIDDTTGTFEVRLGDQVLTALTKTGQDTKPGSTTGIDRFSFVGSGNQLTDLYLDDQTIHGNCIIDVLYPAGAGEYAQWTPSAGANFENVDDDGALDGDATQNSSPVLSAMDSFELDNLRARTGSVVKGIAVTLVGRKDCVAVREIGPVVRVGGNDYAKFDALALTDQYAGKEWIWEENPYTSAPWEQTEVNTMQMGYQLISAE